MSRSAENRRSAILALLTERGRASVDDLTEILQTTPQTIRKDLARLGDENKVIRYHGGATLLAGIEYMDFDARRIVAANEKQRIGVAVARLIPNNVAIMINSGTTTAAVAQSLRFHSGLNLTTDSVQIANEIRSFRGVQVAIPGGNVRDSDGSITGHSAIEFLRQFRPDIAVIGVAAIGRDGALLDYDIAEVEVARAIIENSRTVILAADSSKFDRVAPVRITGLDRVDTLVTDSGLSEAFRQLCRAQSVRVVEA